jgi:hypothetical protein
VKIWNSMRHIKRVFFLFKRNNIFSNVCSYYFSTFFLRSHSVGFSIL